ncbi:hypothetical protein GCM10027280_41570 [Micromonospora polyrhachis]
MGGGGLSQRPFAEVPTAVPELLVAEQQRVGRDGDGDGCVVGHRVHASLAVSSLWPGEPVDQEGQPLLVLLPP